MLLSTLLVVQCSALVLLPNRGSSIATAAKPFRRIAPALMYDYQKQFAEQQAAQREARRRRMEAEEAAKAGGPAKKTEAGFTGGIQEDDNSDGTPKVLRYDERVTAGVCAAHTRHVPPPSVGHAPPPPWTHSTRLTSRVHTRLSTVGWESSDVPDFVPEEGSAAAEKYADLLKIKFTDGIRGSQHDGDAVADREESGPELQITADPTLVFVPDGEDCDAECQLEAFGARDFVLPSDTSLDAELDMFVIGDASSTLDITVKPVAMAFEDFYCGFTADSHPAFSVTAASFGKMVTERPRAQLLTECHAARRPDCIPYGLHPNCTLTAPYAPQPTAARRSGATARPRRSR